MDEKILIADDDELVRSTIERILTMFSYQVVAVEDGRQVLEQVDDSFDTIILDINMPEVDGFQALEGLNAKKLDIPVIFLTGAGSMDYAVKAINLGAYDFITKPLDDIDIFHVKIKRAIEKRMFVLRERRYREHLESEVKRQTKELAEKNVLLEQYSRDLENATVQIMSSLQTAMEEKDEYTAGHTRRVTEYALLLGKELGLTADEMVVLQRAALFHDIGKLVIDLSCICKPEALDEEEWELIKKHPEIGANIIEPLSFLKRERQIIRHHHERIDGTGYPDGLESKELDMLTRIIIIADSFDAMTSRRNYRPNLSTEEAFIELRRYAGNQFDQELVEIFSKVIVEEGKV